MAIKHGLTLDFRFLKIRLHQREGMNHKVDKTSALPMPHRFQDWKRKRLEGRCVVRLYLASYSKTSYKTRKDKIIGASCGDIITGALQQQAIFRICFGKQKARAEIGGRLNLANKAGIKSGHSRWQKERKLHCFVSFIKGLVMGGGLIDRALAWKQRNAGFDSQHGITGCEVEACFSVGASKGEEADVLTVDGKKKKTALWFSQTCCERWWHSG
ncbi:hypothetical protein PoB_003739300 [Plakobranchus ocellatus]|uniref:Uncharacterized protein n=1 Tax=Plakobranchus ocellatus TaxID=259542 RepID=A0AAV4AWJ5_9GAST|nr:hypothetical protein PoB_003739300 [Plakobranchus ocellatus]